MENEVDMGGVGLTDGTSVSVGDVVLEVGAGMTVTRMFLHKESGAAVAIIGAEEDGVRLQFPHHAINTFMSVEYVKAAIRVKAAKDSNHEVIGLE